MLHAALQSSKVIASGLAFRSRNFTLALPRMTKLTLGLWQLVEVEVVEVVSVEVSVLVWEVVPVLVRVSGSSLIHFQSICLLASGQEASDKTHTNDNKNN